MKLTRLIGVFIIIGVLLLWAPMIVAAQDGIISEAEFWHRLELTELALEYTSSESITEVSDLWRDVAGVRLPDETVIKVDVRWLQLNNSSTASDRQQVRLRARALLAFHALRSESTAQSGDELTRLENVLQQKQFRYGSPQAVESEPAEDGSRASSNSPALLPPSLAQMGLIAAGLIVVLGLLVYLWRTLQVQPAAVGPDSETMPGSSQDATQKAEELKAVSDYRAAIRQLYLASLLVLDEQGIIRYDATLTNREHLEQLREQPRPRELMAQVVAIFDRVWYGFAPADEALYRTFRQYLEQLRQSGR